MAGEQLQSFFASGLLSLERLVGCDYLAHLGFYPLQVVAAERLSVGQRKVVVEAVLYRRADSESRTGKQRKHRLSQHMGGGVANSVKPFIRLLSENSHFVAVCETVRKVDLAAVHFGVHGIFGQPLPYGTAQIGRSGARRQGSGGAVRKRDGYLRHKVKFKRRSS